MDRGPSRPRGLEVLRATRVAPPPSALSPAPPPLEERGFVVGLDRSSALSPTPLALSSTSCAPSSTSCAPSSTFGYKSLPCVPHPFGPFSGGAVPGR
jgi:hypothetical protein